MGNSSSSSSGGDRHDANNDGSSNEGASGSGGSSSAGAGRRTSLGSRGLSHRIVGGGSNNNSGGGGGGRSSAISSSLPHLNLPSSFPSSPFGRGGGSLGLSKAELDERCKPSGLYPTCEWEPKQIRRLISNNSLAPRLSGTDARLSKTDRECPICFMYYSSSNVSKCCNATLCTECYLQIKPGKDRYCICPFCNNPKMVVTVAKGMDDGDVREREEEEQRVIEATIKSRVSELHGESPGPSNHADGGGGRDRAESFGSSLENYNRRRTFSNASGGSGGVPGSPINPTGSGEDIDPSNALLSLAMTPEDRRALESEMRAQLSHATHRNIEREEEQARMQHVQEWYGTRGAARSRVREARLAELTGLLERMSARGGGAASNGDNDNGPSSSSSMMAGNNNSLMAGAGEGFRGAAGPRGGGASLSRLLRAMENSSSARAGGTGLEDLMRLEAAFFMGLNEEGRGHRATRGLLSGARNMNDLRGVDPDGGDNTNNNNDDDDDGELADGFGGLERGLARTSPFGLGARPGSRPVVRRLGGAANNRGVSSTHMDTAELLMRGVSEEEQLAMAIAMSMQDSQENNQPSEQSAGGEGQRAAQAEENSDDDDDDSSSSGESVASLSSMDSFDENAAAAAAAAGEQRDTATANNSTNHDPPGVRNGNHDGRTTTSANGNNGRNANGAVSLGEDEEQVVFTDVAEI